MSKYIIRYRYRYRYEFNKFVNILDTFDFIQQVNMPTHSSGHLLDYIITRKDNNFFYPTSLFLILSPTIRYCMPHPVRKQIQVRALRRINDVAGLR